MCGAWRRALTWRSRSLLSSLGTSEGWAGELDNRIRFTVSGTPRHAVRETIRSSDHETSLTPSSNFSLPPSLPYIASFSIERNFPSAFRSVPDYSSRFSSWSLSVVWTSCPRNIPSDCGFGKKAATTGINAAINTPSHRTAVDTANPFKLRGPSALGHKKLPYMKLV